MADRGLDLEPSLNALNSLILGRPLAVVAAFLAVTVLLTGGLGMIETVEDQSDAFSEDIDAQEALDAVNEEFGATFGDSEESTQLLQESQNALSKPALLRSLAIIERTNERAELRLTDATGPATIIAQQLDPDAEGYAAQRRAISRASETELRTAVRQSADRPGFQALVSEDFNRQTASAGASITVLTHSFPPQGDNLQEVQLGVKEITERSDGDIRVFGLGITNSETANVIGDSLGIVMPAVLGLILLFLIVAYRDPIDLVLGLVALLLTLLWTFGFIGYAGIPFDQNMISVPILLLAVGIDFGIHIVNRYREEKIHGFDVREAMTITNSQLAVAFAIVTVTTVFGFGANLTSNFQPTRNFAIVASVGIIFTFLIFSFFLPAAKIIADRNRERFNVPSFGSAPLATEESILGRILPASATISKRAPIALLLLFLVISGGAAAYGQGVDRSFEQEDFLPPEDLPDYIEGLPEPFAPSEYTAAGSINFIEDNFAAGNDDQITMYIEGPFTRDAALESVYRTTRDPPDTYLTTDNRAETTSIITVINDYADRDPEFAALVARNDRDGNGVPDRNLEQIYDALESSPAADRTDEYLTEDRRAIRVEFAVESDASQGEITADSREYAEEFRAAATPTGTIVVFQAVTDLIFQSAFQSLFVAIGLTGIFLVGVYWLLERKPLLGVVNVFPILVTVAVLLATMRVLGLSLNAVTATILSITVGVGVAYSVHMTHRFIDEYTAGKSTDESLKITLQGTGGALTGSMLTTSIGTGALVLAISPILGQFGLLMAVSVFYSFVAAIVVFPSTAYIWARYDQGGSLRDWLWERTNSTPQFASQDE
ncbi:efflux RND transporter permease subunit [Halonotius roseus]|uniref:RND transporter n=1 Tax=Halonotius roseus TaxID=2511997 RepID=A0A544QRI3_9EURY|nr:MMPL family transporter [Halonotius roseus]TQQ82048.1 RND transporter [Halonotius roseus]